MTNMVRLNRKITSSETGLVYVLRSKIGEGGFGAVYIASISPGGRRMPSTVCLKISRHMKSWMQEVHFAGLLIKEPRVIEMYDAFPIVQRNGTLYCLALEYAEQGDLQRYLGARGTGLSESVARREIRAIVRVLVRLGGWKGLHRDLTPFNIFVTRTGLLKVGDFGIAKHSEKDRGVIVDAVNPFVAPTSILFGDAKNWQVKDDLYQVGQLLGMLISGSADKRLSTSDVRDLPCSDQLKEVIHRCLGVRHKRYTTAQELLDALSKPPKQLRSSPLATLSGINLTFTGRLSVSRAEAAVAARRAGAIVHEKPSRKVDVVVRGRANLQQVAGPDGGVKLMDLKRLRAQGRRISIIDERQFWSLIKSRGALPTTARRRSNAAKRN